MMSIAAYVNTPSWQPWTYSTPSVAVDARGCVYMAHEDFDKPFMFGVDGTLLTNPHRFRTHSPHFVSVTGFFDGLPQGPCFQPALTRTVSVVPRGDGEEIWFGQAWPSREGYVAQSHGHGVFDRDGRWLRPVVLVDPSSVSTQAAIMRLASDANLDGKTAKDRFHRRSPETSDTYTACLVV